MITITIVVYRDNSDDDHNNNYDGNSNNFINDNSNNDSLIGWLW